MGIVSFKGFTAYKKRGMKLEDEEILAVMGLIADHGGLFAAQSVFGELWPTLLEELNEELNR